MSPRFERVGVLAEETKICSLYDTLFATSKMAKVQTIAVIPSRGPRGKIAPRVVKPWPAVGSNIQHVAGYLME